MKRTRSRADFNGSDDLSKEANESFDLTDPNLYPQDLTDEQIAGIIDDVNQTREILRDIGERRRRAEHSDDN
jgi:hypothetical protein